VAILVMPALALGCSTRDSTDGAAVDASTDRPTPGTPSADCPNEARANELQTRLSALVDGLLDDHPDTNGIAVHVEAPAACLSQTFVAGLADPMSGVELDPDHAVRMASNTKTYVAAAVLRLVEDGTLGLEDPISTHMETDVTDALQASGYDVESITVLHLLSHTSGLYDYATDPRYADAVTDDPTHRWTRTEQLRFALRHGKPYAMPGEEFHYADTGYILLGEIMERLSGKPLALALRELIGYEQLGLDGTWLETLEPVPAGVKDRAHQFVEDVDTYAWDPSFDLYGGGGLAATVRDMATFTRALLTGEVFRQPETLSLMTETRVAPGQVDYGLGISAIQDAGVRGWGHNGMWNTFSYHYPDLDATIAGSISQRQAFDVSDVLRREAIAALRD
jgi:D-alanyl-D-alanine carboxypeptidase